MTTIIIIILFLVLCSCEMKNEDIIAETKKCSDANMNIVVYRNLNSTIKSIQCTPEDL